ncbi:hypothetical protein ASPZODRAFT_20334 [Penicilliopsis zonata CBS 506.65]|uniref:Methyltransferase domain-containing protein n=1 Tax=Penicilliopsis zonata CBS 506.65 TaxID=1073090 RepID=A0A1L9S5X6_9EURO|nr:hypothetical protein ASPZODRAFT_20334 [Penicilliopsis zonata CBS 506.65]OJJ42564.1 hypothetical protein ASPZODRAFT_20334 [Penicilliopsis zonata CBS 506.65]
MASIPSNAATVNVAEESSLVVDDAANDDPRNDSDNASLDASGSEFTSLRSSILDYQYENGRRYQNYRKGEYLFPNDDEEQDRMDFLHHVYGMILGGELHLAPIKNPQRVLDIGTGTGIWAMDFADQYPSAEVVGNDLSPIQPGWLPPNCVFEIDDFEAEWEYNRPFDYVHGRELAGAVKDINRLAEQAFNNIKSGGYFELQAFTVKVYSDDGSLEERGPFTVQMCELIAQAGEKFGKPMQNMDTWPAALEAAGFLDVKTQVFKVPFSPWPKDEKQKNIGRYCQSVHSQGLSSYLPGILSTTLGWTELETTVMVAKVKNELKDLSVHQYNKLYVIYGRKP